MTSPISPHDDGPAVSVTVVLHNSASCIEATLDSVRDDVASGIADLVVVDNASPDDSVALARQACPEATIVRSDQNRYFAGGCNLAWPYVSGRYWLLLNPDVVVPANGLRDLVAWMDAHPAVGVASPEFVTASGDFQPAAGRFPSIGRSLTEMLRLHRLMSPSRRAQFFLGPYWHGGEHVDVDWVPGAAMIARREAVDAVGLLAEHLPMYAEDTEWCWRMRRHGYRVAVTDGMAWRHTPEQSSSRTWDPKPRKVRIWRGLYASSEVRRGRTYTKLLWAVNLLAFTVEGLHPGRTSLARTRSRVTAAAHLQLAVDYFRRKRRSEAS